MRVIFVGDIYGISQLVDHIPNDQCVAIVGAQIRPQYFLAMEQLASTLDVPFLVQPRLDNSKYHDFIKSIRSLNADLIWVNSYSMIIRDDFLSAARLGAINIHSALLPCNRGCNPIQWAIINGQTESGVTLHEITSGIDEGPIIDQRSVPIEMHDDWIMVRDRISTSTDDLIVANKATILSGTWKSFAQDATRATFGHRRTAADGQFEWSFPVIDIYNQIRALLPPLPPAFYLDESGRHISMTRFLSLQEVTDLKYGDIGSQVLKDDIVLLRPFNFSETNHGLNFPDPSAEESFDKDLIPITPKFDNNKLPPSTFTDSLSLAIVEVTSDHIIGFCQLRSINWQARYAELYLEVRDDVNHFLDLHISALQLICKFASSNLKIHCLYTRCLATDDSTLSSFSKTGFHHVAPEHETAVFDALSDHFCFMCKTLS